MGAAKLAAGNWKMNGTSADLGELEELARRYASAPVDILICPPATLLSRAAAVAGPIAVGGQDCHAQQNGAHTGDISADMIRDAGGAYVIVGHSERRTDHGEDDAAVAAKAKAAIQAGLTAIICVGETLEEREAGETLNVIGRQITGSVPAGGSTATIVVAYEPVWAIGTGKVPTLDEIGEVHAFIRAQLGDNGVAGAGDVSLLYGGSVKPSNASDIFGVANVDGALVGGASLRAADFGGIIDALAGST